MESKSVIRRRHSRELKAEVLSSCGKPGASVAAIAMAYGLNTNLVHKWRRNTARGVVLPPSALGINEFIAIPLTAPPVSTALPDIRIELRRGPTTMTVNWPTAGASQCAAWLREWLRGIDR
ncbi:MAG TPA: transposase [Casimicrobiaceae bacterium]|nr:transposase [Casimicrobiaceae bacterium]